MFLETLRLLLKVTGELKNISTEVTEFLQCNPHETVFPEGWNLQPKFQNPLFIRKTFTKDKHGPSVQLETTVIYS